MRKEKLIAKDLEDTTIKNGVSWLATMPRDQLERFLSRNYEPEFRRRIIVEYEALSKGHPCGRQSMASWSAVKRRARGRHRRFYCTAGKACHRDCRRERDACRQPGLSYRGARRNHIAGSPATLGANLSRSRARQLSCRSERRGSGAPAGLERDYYVHVNLERRKAPTSQLVRAAQSASALKIA